MGIKIKYKDPKSTDFGPNDIVINVKTGAIFYKSEKNLFKLQGDNLDTTTDTIIFNSNISASKGFFTGYGIGDMVVGSQNSDVFEIGTYTLEVKGGILPTATAEPQYDLGSIDRPWRDLYKSEGSIHYVSVNKGIGFSKIGSTFIVGNYKNETNKTKATLSYISSKDALSFTGDISASGNVSGLNITASGGIRTEGNNSSLNIGGNITSSGNISASGGTSIFGQVVHLEGTDPRLKLKAKGANHPGIEWHEDSTRKWVEFNDPANDHLTWKNASDTELMELDQDGFLYVSSKIVHLGDTDTFINFTDDDINIQAGGVNMLDFTQDTQNEVTFNEAAANLDFRIESADDTKAFYIDANVNAIQLGTATGTHVTASGNISASGAITALSSNIVTIDGGSF